MNDDPSLMLPDWPAPAGVHALCTTREGGVSAGNFASLNLGGHVGDDPLAVRANRDRLRERLGGARPVFLKQVHGTECVALDDASVDGTRADACSSTQRRVACTIMVADCLPVLFTDERGLRVAAAHAGWRGLAAGVLERTVAGFATEGGAPRLLAWLGPCIGPDAFEVGDEVRAVFVEASSQDARFFRPAGTEGKWMADLAGLARRRLQGAGLVRIHGNDSSEPWCTVHNPLRFFSHRRDRTSGRFAACIWRS